MIPKIQKVTPPKTALKRLSMVGSRRGSKCRLMVGSKVAMILMICSPNCDLSPQAQNFTARNITATITPYIAGLRIESQPALKSVCARCATWRQ